MGRTLASGALHATKAAMVGVATVLIRKPDPDQHWADPHAIAVVDEDRSDAGTGAPPPLRTGPVVKRRGAGPRGGAT